MPSSNMGTITINMENLDRVKEVISNLQEESNKRLELLRDALEFIDGMTLAEAELRMAIEKELADANS